MDIPAIIEDAKAELLATGAFVPLLDMAEGEIEGLKQKQCEQCKKEKLLSEFHRRKNKTDNRMRICGVCYCENLRDTRRKAEEGLRRMELARQREREERECQLEQEQKEHRQKLAETDRQNTATKS